MRAVRVTEGRGGGNGCGAKMAKGAVVRSQSVLSGTSSRRPPRALLDGGGGGCCFSPFDAPVWQLEDCCASLPYHILAPVRTGQRAWPTPGWGGRVGAVRSVWRSGVGGEQRGVWLVSGVGE